MARLVRVKYRSRFEQHTADWFRRLHVSFEYETVRLKYAQLVHGGVCPECKSKRVLKNRTYTTDFSFPKRTFYVETKGYFPASDRTKLLALQQEGYDIRLVFQRDNKLNKTSGTTYAQWAARHGFQYAIGTPDPKWFNASTTGGRRANTR